jgi:hypothetical protein
MRERVKNNLLLCGLERFFTHFDYTRTSASPAQTNDTILHFNELFFSPMFCLRPKEIEDSLKENLSRNVEISEKVPKSELRMTISWEFPRVKLQKHESKFAPVQAFTFQLLLKRHMTLDFW